MAQTLKCLCGKTPSFICVKVAEDAVESQFVCRRGNQIPGGGFLHGGCGQQGPVIEYAYSDREQAAFSWNAMIRKMSKASRP